MSVFGGNDGENQKDYTWEIRNIEDANEWIENIELDKEFSLKQINGVYHLYNNNGLDALSRDLDILLNELSQEVSHEKFYPYIIKMDKPAELKSNRIIKDLDSANQWIADIGYEGAIRFCFDGSSWSVQIFEENWYTEKTVSSFRLALKGVLSLIIPEPKPEIDNNIDKNIVALIDSLETANQWLQSLIEGEDKKFVYRKNPFYKEGYFLINNRKSEIMWATTLKDCIINSCEKILREEIPNISDKLGVAPEKELRTIRSIKDVNDWLKSIGRDTEYTVEFAKGIKEVGTGIKCTRKEDNSIVYFSKEIEKVVDKIAKEIQGAKPLCKNTIYDITTLNLWLDTIDFKNNGGRRPYIFKKKTEHGNIYSVWDIYKNGDKAETKLEFINTSLQISLGYIVVTGKIKNYLWDVQLKKESVKKGLDITIDNLETANKWVDSLGYGNYIKFNCKSHVQNTPKGKVKYPAYYLQERLSGDNWKIVNNTYGKFNDILNMFCKLANITEIPKCTIVFTPQLVEEQKMNEIIQSVKGANIWFEKINIQGCKFRIKSREDKQNKRIYTIEFMNPQGQIGKFYECASLKESIDYFCKCYQIKAPAVAKNM